VIVRARNLRGWGPYSQINTQAPTIESIPSQVTSLSYDISQTNNE
jgi:hypothetical protein